MRSYIKLYSDFWRDHNNAELISLGLDAQFLALYLLSNPHNNMLGVYFLPVPYIAIDVKEPIERVEAALWKLCKINYCRYDKISQYVWVCNMAAEQIGNLEAKDNRLKPIQATWNSLPPLPFLDEIYQKYRSAFHLEPRVFAQSGVAISSRDTQEPFARVNDTPSEGGRSPLPKGDEPPLRRGSATPSEGDDAAATRPSEASTKNANTPSEGANTLIESKNIAYYPFRRGYDYPSEGVATTLQEGVAYPFGSNTEYRSRIQNTEYRRQKREEEAEGEENLNHCRASATGGDEIHPAENFVLEEKNLPQVVEENLPDSAAEDFLHWEENQPPPITEENPPPAAAENLPQTAGESLSPLPAKPPNASPPAKAPTKRHLAHHSASDEHITQVFAHWKATMRHEKSNLDAKRRALIRQALQLGYSVEQLCQAITGCSLTPHNMGQNDRGQRYDGLHIILRDADQIDRFIHNYLHPPRPFTKADQRLQANVSTMQQWLQKKLAEPDTPGASAC